MKPKDMTLDRAYLKDRLAKFWQRLPHSKLMSQWQVSRRFPELTYVREDLVGSYKARKYRSLIPWLLEHSVQTVRLRGSSHSGNMMHLSLLLRQKGIEPIYTLEGREGPPVGHGLLNRLILGSNFDVDKGREADFTLPEGANCDQALAGSLGLVGSLFEQLILAQEWPEQILIDSGTGFTAASLILGLGYFEWAPKVVVVSMTGQTRTELDRAIEALKPEYERLLDSLANPQPFRMEYPISGRSFGSLPTQVFEEIQNAAQYDGILFDPLYSAKLSLWYQYYRFPKVSTLMLVGGGHADLLGFQNPLAHWLRPSKNESKE